MFATMSQRVHYVQLSRCRLQKSFVRDCYYQKRVLPCEKIARLDGWTNVNLLYFPDSKQIASLEGLTLCFTEVNQSKQSLA